MTDATPDETIAQPVTTPPRQPNEVSPEEPLTARLNVQIPTELDTRLREECKVRMIGPALLVAKAIETFLDTLPPAL
jgi:hypothetical protein